MNDTVLVTGANRGIGLEIVSTLLERGHRALATCRDPDGAEALRAPGLDASHDGHDGHLEVLAPDVGDAGSVRALAASLAGRTIDAPVNNAGRMRRERGIDDVDYDDWALTFAIDTRAPPRVATALGANLPLSSRPRVLTVSSQTGSIERAGTGSIAYRTSKAAVNMAMRVLSEAELREGERERAFVDGREIGSLAFDALDDEVGDVQRLDTRRPRRLRGEPQPRDDRAADRPVDRLRGIA